MSLEIKQVLTDSLSALPWIALGTLIFTGLMAFGTWMHSRKVNKIEDELVAHFEKFDSAEAELNAYKRLLETEGYQWRMADNMIKRAKKRVEVINLAKDLNVGSAAIEDIRNIMTSTDKQYIDGKNRSAGAVTVKSEKDWVVTSNQGNKL